jgi:hypothetical protein
MDKKYRVMSPKALYISWNLGLFNDKQLEEWTKYRKEVTVGMDDQERLKYEMQPEAVKIRDWATAKGMGVDDVAEAFKKGEITRLPSGRVAELKFYIPANEEVIISETQKKQLERFVKRPLKQKLQPGQSKPEIQYEGFLTIEEYIEDDNTTKRK